MSSFTDAAIKLSRNPLGLIALFVVLVEAIAGYAAVSEALSDSQRSILVWFVILYPVLVFASFVYLVIKHPAKLYAPGDFADQTHFMEALGIKVQKEVERVTYEAEGELASLDIELIPIWEAEYFKKPEDSAKKLDILESYVSKLEEQTKNKEGLEKVASITALRRTYIEYLRHARSHFASSKDYQHIKNRVLKGLENIKKNEI